MEPVRIGVIGGSGLYQMEGLVRAQTVRISTPFGEPSDQITVGELAGARVAFLARHGQGHRHIPSQVPYHANIYALKSLGVQQLISVSACGSLREALQPGQMVIPDQLYDNTKFRSNTFFGEGLAAHISVAEPFCARLSGLLAESVSEAGGTVHRGGRLITIEGPRFSTKGESHTFRSWGMDLINMTTCPEAFLAREAEMCYAVVNAISDYDVWHSSEAPVTVEMVIDILNRNAKLAQKAIALLVAKLAAQDGGDCACQSALRQALLTRAECVPPETRQRLRLLVAKYLT